MKPGYKATRVLLLLALTGSTLGSAENNPDRMRAFQTTVHEYFADALNTMQDDLVIEYPDLERKLSSLPVFDEFRVLPDDRPPKSGIQIITCGLFYRHQLKKIVKLKVRVRKYQTVVVSRATMRRFSAIQPDLVSLDRRETTHYRTELYFSKAALVGMRTKRVVRPMEILTPANVEPLPLVARGSYVELHFEKGGIEIILPGVARQDGQMGEKILVKCEGTRKTFRGEILDAKTVMINF